MKIHRLAMLALFLQFSISTPAAPLTVGDAAPAITAKDQQGADFILTTNLQFLLVATEMAAAKAANHKLAEHGAGFLEKHSAAWLMDIHTMPAVARWLAFPKLRKYPQRIILVDSAETLAAVPIQPGCVTVLVLSSGRIRKISFWNPEHEPVSGCF